MYSFLLLMQKVMKAKNTFGSIELLVKPAVRHEQYVLIIHSSVEMDRKIIQFKIESKIFIQ